MKTDKNGMTDVEAACEIVTRMRFGPVKNIERQAILNIHRSDRDSLRQELRGRTRFDVCQPQYGVTTSK